MNLEKIRHLFPDFQIKNFNMFDTITLLKWETEFDEILGEEHRNLTLVMTSFNHYQIQLKFLGVKSLTVDSDGHVAGFYIEDMSERGYESWARYEVGDYEERAIHFYCGDVIIEGVEKL